MSFLEIYDQDDDIPLAPQDAPPRRRPGGDAAGVPAFLQTQRRRIVPSEWPPAQARRADTTPATLWAPGSAWKTPFAIAMQVVACAAVIAAGGIVVTGFMEAKAPRTDATAEPLVAKSDRIVPSGVPDVRAGAAPSVSSKDETRLAPGDGARLAAAAPPDAPANAALNAIAKPAPASEAPDIVTQLASLAPTDPNAAVAQALRDAAAAAPVLDTANTDNAAPVSADDQVQQRTDNTGDDAASRSRVASRHSAHHRHAHRRMPSRRTVAPPARAQTGTQQAEAAAPATASADPVATALRKLFNPAPADPNNAPVAARPAP